VARVALFGAVEKRAFGLFGSWKGPHCDVRAVESPARGGAGKGLDRLNRALKRAVRLSVIAFGRMTPPQRGEDLLRALRRA
jgi:hypothetical protein